MRSLARHAGLMVLLLPLLSLPLRAQESAQGPAPTTPVPAPASPPASPPATPPASSAPPPSSEAPPAEAEPDPGEERVSADNNLSFPVDI